MRIAQLVAAAVAAGCGVALLVIGDDMGLRVAGAIIAILMLFVLVSLARNRPPA